MKEDEQTEAIGGGLFRRGTCLIDARYANCERELWQRDGHLLSIESPARFRPLQFLNEAFLSKYQPHMRWFTDDSWIYARARQGRANFFEYYYRIEGADPDSFVVLNERYARDANNAYFIGEKTLRNIRAAQFFPLPMQWWVLNAEGKPVHEHRSYHQYVAGDGQSIFNCGRKIDVADPTNFRLLSERMASDGQCVYYQNKATSLDVKSFVVIHQDFLDDGPSEFFTDRHGPVTPCGGQERVADIAVADSWNRIFLTHPDLQDYWWHRMPRSNAANHPLAPIYRGKPLYDMDIETFKVQTVIGLWGSDSLVDLVGDASKICLIHSCDQGEHYDLQLIAARDIAKVRSLAPGYWTDGVCVYLQETCYAVPTCLKKIDLASFSDLGFGWVEDKDRIYFRGAEKRGLDRSRFTVHGWFAWDDRQLFSEGKPMEVSVPHHALSCPHPHFLIAGDRLFYGRKPVSAKRVHLPSLQFLSPSFARDQFHWYKIDSNGLREIENAPAGLDPAP